MVSMSGEEKRDHPAFQRGGLITDGRIMATNLPVGDITTAQLRVPDPVSPDHYQFPGGAQVIDITKHLGFLAGNVVKYVARADRKGGLTDLLKARQYLDWLIEKEQMK